MLGGAVGIAPVAHRTASPFDPASEGHQMRHHLVVDVLNPLVAGEASFFPGDFRRDRGELLRNFRVPVLLGRVLSCPPLGRMTP